MNTKWACRVAILGVVVMTAGLGALPASAAGPTFGLIITSANPAIAGQSVRIALVVRGSTPFVPPLGIVQLFDGLLPLGPPLVLSPTLLTDHSEAVLFRSFTPGTHLLTLNYSGDPFFGDLPIFMDDLVTLVVTAPQSTTTVSSSTNPAVYGQSVTWTASASNSGSPASGSIQFKADGANAGGPQPVDASGNAFFSPSPLSVGNHPVSADFTSSDPSVLDSSGSLAGGQVVTAADTTSNVSSSASPSDFGAPTTFTASVSVNSPGAGTPTGSVQFQDNGTDLGLPQSLGGGGHPSVTTSSLSVGSHTITVAFTSDSANFNGSAGTTTQIVQKARTTLSYDGAAGADFDDPGILSARLTRTDSASPVAGQTVTLTMGSESCSVVTDSNGEAVCTITPSEPAGARPVTAVFTGDANYQSSSDSTSFAVTREETSTTYTGPTVIAQGNPVTLAGRLLEDGITPIAGRTLTLTIGAGVGSQQCVTGLTDGSGNAQCTISSLTVTQGPQPVRADFTGDGYYLPSADATKSVIVFAFPSRGIFTLGDRSATGASSTVTFWGAQWATQNPSLGGTPSAFKGFADTPSSKPPVCGGTWTTSPGNSSMPVDSIPAYMGTAVSTSITKNGNTITGTITKIVVVATAQGYASNPGHAGTGTIIASYC
jgi:large repetitive protein